MKYFHIFLCVFLVCVLGFILSQHWRLWLRRILTYHIDPASHPVMVYKDGRYNGDAYDALYGKLQVDVLIDHGKIADIGFPQYPHDRTVSVQTNMSVMPKLKQEAIRVQSAQVQVVTGATDSSLAFIRSLTSALAKAQ
jgi:uncharacterized protein with FMN-binding domain